MELHLRWFITRYAQMAALVQGALGAAQKTTEQDLNAKRTLSLGIVVFPGFEPLDVFGPLELFFSMSYEHKMTLSVISHKAGPITAGAPAQRLAPEQPIEDFGYMLQPTIYATHEFTNAPALDILLVPGGLGNVALEQNNDTSVEDFVRRRFKQVDYMLSVCTGAASLAKAGVLSGRKATTNKGAWKWVTSQGSNITWVPTARWVVDGKVWTSSGVSAGIDMAYAFLAHLYGSDDEALIRTMNGIEYAPHENPHWDPFSVVHKVPGADMSANITDCVRPVGH